MNDTTVKKSNICILQVLLTMAIAAAYAVSLYLCTEASVLAVILWLFASIIPLGLFVAVCIKFRGLPEKLRSKKGGILMLLALALLLTLITILIRAIVALILFVVGIYVFCFIQLLQVPQSYTKTVQVYDPSVTRWKEKDVTVYTFKETSEEEQIETAINQRRLFGKKDWRYRQ